MHYSLAGLALNHLFSFSNLQPHYNMNVPKEAHADLCWDVSFFNGGWSSRGVEREAARQGRSYNSTGIIKDNVVALMSCTCAFDGPLKIPIQHTYTYCLSVVCNYIFIYALCYLLQYPLNLGLYFPFFFKNIPCPSFCFPFYPMHTLSLSSLSLSLWYPSLQVLSW